MKIKTLNSEYIVNSSQLWRNGELYTDNITYIGGMATDLTTIYDGIPNVGDRLYIEHHKGYIRTSTVTEVSND